MYVLKIKDVIVGRYVGYFFKYKFLNLSYDIMIDVILDKSFYIDI